MTVQDIDTPREPVITTYHGVEVTDDYQWLEDASSEWTRRWTEAQAARTEEYLSSLPDREALRRRAQAILAVESTSYAHPRGAGGRYFALKHQPPKQQSFLVALAALDALDSEQSWSTRTSSIRPGRRPSTGTSRLRTAGWSPCRCLRTAPRTAVCTSSTSPRVPRWSRRSLVSTAVRRAARWPGGATGRVSGTPGTRALTSAPPPTWGSSRTCGSTRLAGPSRTVVSCPACSPRTASRRTSSAPRRKGRGCSTGCSAATAASGSCSSATRPAVAGGRWPAWRTSAWTPPSPAMCCSSSPGSTRPTARCSAST